MSQSVSRIATRILTHDGVSQDPYDHEINLVDATESATQDEPRSSSPSPSWKQLVKKPTRSSVKDHRTRRKYAKWQEDGRGSKPSSIAAEDDSASRPSSSRAGQDPSRSGTHAVDFAREEPVEKDRKSADARKRNSKAQKGRAYEIDILYENQRGSFFAGIPLYSHSSLLPTDPGPWVGKDFRDSPVNITNAQVPDPSWEWAWKTWYVDMSYDVDEEGWQYSFAFAPKWVWHGTHPWFHSFVRRRRWLRKRVKTDHETEVGLPGSMHAAHDLTAEYFTIHSQRDRSPVSAVDGPGKTARPSSYISYPSATDIDQPPEDVKNIASLLKALKIATIDREKIDLVNKFVDEAGEELAYLKNHIPNIMSFLIFQNSRRQLLTYLKETANEARQHRQSHNDENKPEGDAENRRINNILAAVDAANAQIGGLEFWSDRKHVLRTVESENLATRNIATIFDDPAPKPQLEDDPVREIKGISEKAEIDNDDVTAPVGPLWQSSIEHEKQQEEKDDKGKGRALENEDDRDVDGTPPRLKLDQVLIPHQD